MSQRVMRHSSAGSATKAAAQLPRGLSVAVACLVAGSAHAYSIVQFDAVAQGDLVETEYAQPARFGTYTWTAPESEDAGYEWAFLGWSDTFVITGGNGMATVQLDGAFTVTATTAITEGSNVSPGAGTGLHTSEVQFQLNGNSVYDTIFSSSSYTGTLPSFRVPYNVPFTLSALATSVAQGNPDDLDFSNCGARPAAANSVCVRESNVTASTAVEIDRFLVPQNTSMVSTQPGDVYDVVPVPEPETWALMAGGLLGLGVVARAKKRE